MNKFSYSYQSQSLTIIASEKDIASVTIAKEVEKLGITVYYLREIKHLYCKDSDLPESDNYIFLSKHSSSSGTPAFTVHSTGNFSDSPTLGGKASLLSYTNADLQSDLLIHLKKQQEESKFTDFDVVAEATHHGPYLNKPTIYFEMGSSESVWNNPEAGKIIANTIQILLFNKYHSKAKNTGIAFGGTHYPEKFTKLMINEEYNIGHICAKYALQHLTEDLVKEMVSKTISRNKIQFAILEKKGMKRKQEIKEILTSKFGLEIVQV